MLTEGNVTASYLSSRKLQKLEQEVDSLRVDLSQVTALKEQLSNEACQLREEYQEEVSIQLHDGFTRHLKGFHTVFVFEKE